MITPDFVKPGATVIDVGMNTVTDPEEFKEFFAGNEKRERDFAAKGSTLMGDVHPKVAEVAGAMTPVPGGVGPLTIAMLMSNTVKAAKSCAASHNIIACSWRASSRRGSRALSTRAHESQWQGWPASRQEECVRWQRIVRFLGNRALDRPRYS
jgi:hypothetical protein